MIETEFTISPEDYHDTETLQKTIASLHGSHANHVPRYKILRRSIDARKRPPIYRVRVAIYKIGEEIHDLRPLQELPDVSQAREVHIIGAGPAGYFAALECIKLNLRPVILERGKDVQSRRKDLRSIQQEGIVNPHSNYCFGEGGAGTYSDGKLYTRSNKRGSIDSILAMLVEAGADPDIAIDAHPHIGSNKLPPLIARLREVIESRGGEIRFNTWVTDFIFDGPQSKHLVALQLNHEERIQVDAVILATGHSARDIFQLLQNRNVHIEAKPFALGVRIEHPQPFVDQCQYGMEDRGMFLPAASYAVNAQVDDRGVFSFCMCPGGLIVPAATAPGEIVVNGMSLSRRDSPYANSGVVTSIELADLQKYTTGPSGKNDALTGMYFQRSVEQNIFQAGNGTQAAPAQRVNDFLHRRLSSTLPESSYIPGLLSAPLHQLLPSWIHDRLHYGIKKFDQKMKGYIHPEAVIVATESRTSSPVRIPRDPEKGHHIAIKELFPCGEGAGYAGGIMSAALDGQWIANAVARQLKERYL